MSIRHVLIVAAGVIVVALGLAVYLAGQEPGPHITIDGPAVIGGGTFVTDISVEGPADELSGLEVWLEQGGRRLPLPSGSPTNETLENSDRVRIRREVSTSSLSGLRDGTARLVAAAERPVLLGLRQARRIEGRDVAVRISPPSLSVISTHHYVRVGGAELVVYRVNPPDGTSGVSVGQRFYRGYPAKGVAGGRGIDPAVHLAFFALPFDHDARTPIRLTAEDAAGNATVIDFPHQVFDNTIVASRITVDDRWLSQVVPAIVSVTPGLDLPTRTRAQRLAAFRTINDDVRRRNDERIAAIAAETAPEWLPRGPFRRLPGALRSSFAERRTYVMGRRTVSEQMHLGFDLASTRSAAVAASATGRVAFAAPLGIYGNCVIIDHGMGVQTLYGHLSSMDVEAGDRVERGEVIGRSGTTGLAGGDHVHFSVLVGGTPVSPVEWWDARWVRDRIERKLAEGGIR